MQYHALSCAKAGYYVEVVGFGGMRYILPSLSLLVVCELTGGVGDR